MASVAEHHAHAPHSSDDVIVRSCLRREILHRSRETCLSRVDQGYEMLMSWLRCHSTAIEWLPSPLWSRVVTLLQVVIKLLLRHKHIECN